MGGGDDSLVVFNKRFPVEKGSVMRTASCCKSQFFCLSFRGETFARFHTVTIKCHSSMGNRLFDLSGRILLNNPLHVNENDEYALNFALHLSRIFLRSALNQICLSNTRVWLMLSSSNDCLIITRVSIVLFPRFAQNLKHTRCRIHREIASGLIHYSK
jgi:hypothetical protein